jgi:phage terminase small subunit
MSDEKVTVEVQEVVEESKKKTKTNPELEKLKAELQDIVENQPDNRGKDFWDLKVKVRDLEYKLNN